MCPPLITFPPPDQKLNASRPEIGVRWELGATRFPVPGAQGGTLARLPLSGSLHHQTSCCVVILQSIFSGLFLLTLGAAEIRCLSSRLCAELAERVDQHGVCPCTLQSPCSNLGIQGLFWGESEPGGSLVPFVGGPGGSQSSSWPSKGDCSFMGTSSLCPGQLLALGRPFNNLLVLS